MRSMTMGMLVIGSLLLLCACSEADEIINPEPVTGKLVFVTSKTYTGELGGIAGADDKCQQLASAAGLSGTYRAWLAAEDAAPAGRFPLSPDPYLRVDGVRVADDWTDLTDGTVLAPIDRDETGAHVEERVWTNVRPDGTHYDARQDCFEWTTDFLAATGATGSCSATGGTWSLVISSGNWPRCSERKRLYCFEQF